MIRSVTLIRETIRTMSFLIRCTPNWDLNQIPSGQNLRGGWMEDSLQHTVRALGVPGHAFRLHKCPCSFPRPHKQHSEKLSKSVCLFTLMIFWFFLNLSQSTDKRFEKFPKGSLETPGRKVRIPRIFSHLPRVHFPGRAGKDGPGQDKGCGWVAHYP